jgi:hypothetical protein
MKENEGLYRTARLIRRLIVGIVTLVAVVAAVGYLFLMRQVDPHAAWSTAQREIDGSILQYGEQPMRVARVYRRRPTNYLRAANGLLVATTRRVIFVGVEPRDKLAGADAPAGILTSEMPSDTLLTARIARIYLLTAHGAILQRGRRTESFAAFSGYDAELDSLVAYLDARRRQERVAALRDRELRAQLAALLKEPLRYVVQRGDALSTIATRFGARNDQIRDWNHLPSDRVRIGDTLLVRPGGR